MKKIVSVKGLKVSFPSSKNKKEIVNIVRDVDFDVFENQFVGFIGESGSGKSVTAKSLLGINNNAITKADELKIGPFSMLDANKELSTSKALWRKVRGKKVAYIPQDSLTSLNPTMKIGKQITEAMKIHGDTEAYKKVANDNKAKREQELAKLKDKYSKQMETAVDKHKLTKKYKADVKKIKDENPITYKNVLLNEAIVFLEKFGISDARQRINHFPHQFSGGMRQRVVIAMMMACGPDLIIADEPTTALDPTVQASVMALFQEVVKTTNVSVILISHDIAVIAKVSDYLYIFYAGAVVEKGTKEDIFTAPRHPYTWSLLSAIPDSSINKKGQKLFTIAGQPPSFENLPKGDPFSVRNPYAMKIDFQKEAPLIKISDSHYAATWLLHPSAPKVEMPAQVKELINITSKEFKNANKKKK